MEAEENKIDHFYEQLQNVLEAIRKHDMLILCGNMNPAVGASNLNRVGIMEIMKQAISATMTGSSLSFAR